MFGKGGKEDMAARGSWTHDFTTSLLFRFSMLLEAWGWETNGRANERTDE